MRSHWLRRVREQHRTRAVEAAPVAGTRRSFWVHRGLLQSFLRSVLPPAELSDVSPLSHPLLPSLQWPADARVVCLVPALWLHVKTCLHVNVTEHFIDDAVACIWKHSYAQMSHVWFRDIERAEVVDYSIAGDEYARLTTLYARELAEIELHWPAT